MTMNGTAPTSKIVLWKQMEHREAWLYCVIMFVAFWVILAIAGALSSIYGPEGTGFFYVIAGFCLGVSETMYWVQRGMKSQPTAS